MKQFGKYISMIFLVAAAGIGAFVIYRSLTLEELISVTGHEVVGKFTFLPEHGLDGWDEKNFSRNTTEYGLINKDGIGCLKAESDNSASALFFRQKLFFERRPFISWDWRVEEFPVHKCAENLEKKKSFDFAAQVYVIFYDRFLTRAKALQYVWTRDVSKGTVVKSPYTRNIKVVVLESGGADEWNSEKRDISGDYEQFFGEPLEKDVMAISFMTDSDSTDSRAVAYYKNVEIGYLGGAGIEIIETGKGEPSNT